MNTNAMIPDQSSQEITRLRRIGVLIYPGCDILDVGGPSDAPGYQCEFLAATPGPVRTSCGLEIIATHSYSDIVDGLDTLIVAGGPLVEQACKDNPALVEWVRAMAPRVRRVASICTGAYILAAAGLLHNRRVTT